jgi:hypothetical protein
MEELIYPRCYHPKDLWKQIEIINQFIPVETNENFIKNAMEACLPDGAEALFVIPKLRSNYTRATSEALKIIEEKRRFHCHVEIERKKFRREEKTIKCLDILSRAQKDAGDIIIIPAQFGARLLEKTLGEKVKFSYPKSLYSVLDTLKIMTKNDDIILDFFAGSGTTGHAVLELNKEDGGNRKFILVEQLNEHIEVCKERIQKVLQKESIESDFVYLELMKWNENFVEKIQKAKTKEELKKLWETMKEKAFLSYKVDIQTVYKNAKDFEDLSIEDQKRFLLECLDKNHLYVNYSEIDDEEYGVSAGDKKLNKEFYG